MKKWEIEHLKKKDETRRVGIAAVAEILLILIIAIHPLYLHPQYGYFDLTGHKANFFYTICWLSALSLIIVWAVTYHGKRSVEIKDVLSSISLIDWAVILYILACCVSVLFSPSLGSADYDPWIGIPEPEGRLDGLLSQLSYACVYFIISRCYKFKQRDFIAFSFSAITVSLIGVQQFFGDDVFSLFPYEAVESQYGWVLDQYSIFFRTTLGNVNIVSTYTCVAAALCLALYIRENSKWRFLHLSAFAMSLWLMILGGSYSGMVGLAVACIAIFIFMFDRIRCFSRFLTAAGAGVFVYLTHHYFYDVRIADTSTVEDLSKWLVLAICLLAAATAFHFLPKLLKEKKGLSVRTSMIIGIGSVFLLAAIALGSIEMVGSRQTSGLIYQMREVMHGNFRDEFGSTRIYIWRNALSVFHKNPITGVGPDNFTYAFNVFDEESASLYGQIFDKAHNEYLQVLICIGILGCIPYVFVTVGSIFRAVAFRLKNAVKPFVTSAEDPYFIAATAALTAYSSQAFFNINTPITAPLLWAMLALISSIILNEKRNQKQRLEVLANPKPPLEEIRKNVKVSKGKSNKIPNQRGRS